MIMTREFVIKRRVRLIVIAICVATMGFIWKGYFKKEVTLPIRTEIEKAIKVKAFENKVERVEKVFFGCGVGVGIGAPQVKAHSAEQFLSLVPNGERIYTALELTREYNCVDKILKKVYAAFIENRAGIVIYEDIHQYQEDNHNFWVKSYTEDNVVFYYNNIGWCILLTGILCFLGVIIVGILL